MKPIIYYAIALFFFVAALLWWHDAISNLSKAADHNNITALLTAVVQMLVGSAISYSAWQAFERARKT